MRYFTIIVAVAFGMALSWIMLLNPQEALVRYNADVPGQLRIPIWQMAMWQVIFCSVAIGIAIGFLLTWGSGSDARARRDYRREPEPAPDNEPDYVLGMSRRK